VPRSGRVYALTDEQNNQTSLYWTAYGQNIEPRTVKILNRPPSPSNTRLLSLPNPEISADHDH